MKRWRVTGAVYASKDLGVYEADTKEQAEEMALGAAYCSVCHQCEGEVSDPQIEHCEASEIED